MSLAAENYMVVWCEQCVGDIEVSSTTDICSVHLSAVSMLVR